MCSINIEGFLATHPLLVVKGSKSLFSVDLADLRSAYGNSGGRTWWGVARCVVGWWEVASWLFSKCSSQVGALSPEGFSYTLLHLNSEPPAVFTMYDLGWQAFFFTSAGTKSWFAVGTQTSPDLVPVFLVHVLLLFLDILSMLQLLLVKFHGLRSLESSITR